MLKRFLLAAVVSLFPVISSAQPNPPFQILAWIDNEWTVFDSNGAVVRTLPITPHEQPGFFSLSRDESKLLFIIRNWQTWEYDFASGTPRFHSQTDWNAASQWLPGSTTEFTFNDSSGRLLKFNTLTSQQSLWQSNDTIGGRVYTRPEYDLAGQRVVVNVHYGGAGGMGVYMGDLCYGDAAHALCNVQPLAWPGNGSASWAVVAANAVLTQNGSRAVYFERYGTNGAIYSHHIASNTRSALLTWSGSSEAAGSVYGPYDDRYVVVNAASQIHANSAAYFVCDTQLETCREVLSRPGIYSLNHAVVARSFGDTTPPVITGPGNLTVEATGPDGAAVTFSVTAIDDIDGSVGVSCTRSSGFTFPKGTTTVRCDAADAAGNDATPYEFTVSVVDTTAPTIVSIEPSLYSLWPPNGKMAPVNLSVDATDTVSAVECRITDVQATSPLTSADWQITGELTVSLRARRPGTSAATYQLTVTCTDGTNSSWQSVSIVVPHDQRK